MAPPRCCAQVQYKKGVQCLKDRRTHRLTCKLHQQLEDSIHKQLSDAGSWNFRDIFKRGKNWMAPKRCESHEEWSNDGNIDYEYTSSSLSDDDEHGQADDDQGLLSDDEDVIEEGHRRLQLAEQAPKQQRRDTPSFSDLCRAYDAIFSRLRAVPGSASTSSPYPLSRGRDLDLNEEEYMMSGALINLEYPPVFPSDVDETPDSDVDDADFADLYRAENAIIGRLGAGPGSASPSPAYCSSSSDSAAERNLDEDHKSSSSSSSSSGASIGVSRHGSGPSNSAADFAASLPSSPRRLVLS